MKLCTVGDANFTKNGSSERAGARGVGAFGLGGLCGFRETSGDEGARGDGVAGSGGTVARHVRPARDEPRVGPVDLGAPRGLLRAAGSGRGRDRRHRGGLGPRVGLALRALPAGRRVRARLGGRRRRRARPRRLGPGGRGAHRGPGIIGLQPASAVGPERCPRGQHARDAQGDGAGRHRCGRPRLRRGGRAGGAQRARRGRGQRRAEQPGAPVPVGAHQPPGRCLRDRSDAVRPRGAPRGAGRGGRWHRRPAALV